MADANYVAQTCKRAYALDVKKMTDVLFILLRHSYFFLYQKQVKRVGAVLAELERLPSTTECPLQL